MPDKITYYFVLPDLGISAKDFNAMPFGRQMEYFKKIAAFQEQAKKVHISQKRQTTAKALKEFKDLYKPTAYYCKVKSGPNWHDDSVEIWYLE